MLELQITDTSGRTWVVPAELVETNMTNHRFLVHKALSLDNDWWIVSHEASGGVVAGAVSKAIAIKEAVQAINNVTRKKFEESLKKNALARKELSLNGYQPLQLNG